MTRTTHALTPARRDLGLRRLRTLNRVLIGAAVVATGLLTDVAAKAFPGHKRTVHSSAVAQAASSSHRTSARRLRHHARHRSHRSHHALKAPAQAPTSTAATTAPPQGTSPAATTPAPAPSVTQAAPTPAPAPAPAPVVSGGS